MERIQGGKNELLVESDVWESHTTKTQLLLWVMGKCCYLRLFQSFITRSHMRLSVMENGFFVCSRAVRAKGKVLIPKLCRFTSNILTLVRLWVWLVELLASFIIHSTPQTFYHTLIPHRETETERLRLFLSRQSRRVISGSKKCLACCSKYTIIEDRRNLGEMKWNESGRQKLAVRSTVGRRSMQSYILTYYRLQKEEPLLALGSY